MENLGLSNRQIYVSDACNLSDEIIYDFDADNLRNKIEWILTNKEEVVSLGATRTELYQEIFHISHFYSQISNIAEFIRFANLGSRPEAFPDYVAWPPALS